MLQVCPDRHFELDSIQHSAVQMGVCRNPVLLFATLAMYRGVAFELRVD